MADAVTLATPWTCPTCKIAVETDFCPTCGETRMRPRDLTLRDLLDQIVEAVISIDAKLIRTLRAVVFKPGALTIAYLEGQRKSYIKPLQLFLVANLLFFGTQSLTHENIFSTTLASHLDGQDWSPFAQDIVARRLAATGRTMETYAPLFDRAILLNAKSLIFLMALVFTAILPLLFRRSGRLFVGHAVFALHLYAFLLILFCAALGLAEVHVLLGGEGLRSESFDRTISLVLVVACATYLYVAVRKVYGVKGIAGAVRAGVLTVVVSALVLAYRFSLLPITLYST